MRPRVVAIDGPAASGKSTTARRVADALGFRHLNSGLLYRAVAWAARQRGWKSDGAPASDDEGGLEAMIASLSLELVPEDGEYGVRIEGADPGAALRSPEITRLASMLSARADVRRHVTELVRREGTRRDIVCDGRDIGTVVFPEADLKIFLDASPEERARRRLLERDEPVTPGTIEEEAGRLRARDRADASRALSPLRAAADAVRVDTTDRTPGEVVMLILDEARRRGISASTV